jgi:hypothetical protein
MDTNIPDDFVFDPHDYLLYALEQYGFAVQNDDGKLVALTNGYSIEIEGTDLWKLREDGKVIAPFADLDELCSFMQRANE